MGFFYFLDFSQIQIEMNYLPEGDKSAYDNENRLQDFKSKITEMMHGQNLPFTFIMDDPSGNSFLQVSQI